MFVSACGGSDVAETGADTTSTTVQTLGETRRLGSPEGLRSALEMAGIEIVEPGARPVQSLQLWSYQVSNMEREIEEGAGYLGAQLDDLAGSPGGMPFSYLVAGWLDSAPTPLAEAALEIMGNQPLEDAPSIIFPNAVITLFVADALEASGALEAAAIPEVRTMLVAQQGLCSTLAAWFNRVLDFIFESLKVAVEDDGFIGWLGTIWNAAVDLARGAIEGLMEILAAPIIEAIASGLAIVGTLSMVASVLQPWSLQLSPSNGSTRFAIGDEPNLQQEVVATADPGYEFEWPAAVEDCASVADLTLPDPTRASGSSVSWREVGIPELGSVTETETTLDSDNRATLDWVTGREDSDQGKVLSGTVSFSAFVDLRQIEELKAMLAHLITGAIPSGPFGSVVSSVFDALTEPIFDTLAEMVRIKGTASIGVSFHDEEESSTTSSQPDAGGQCIVGTWSANPANAAAIYASELLDTLAIFADFSSGSLIAHFSEDGTVDFAFDEWTYGISYYLVEDLPVDQYRVVSGQARGTWTIEGGLLDLAVGEYGTNVQEFSVSENTETSADLPAAAAGQYVIPSAPTRYACQGNELAIEWADTAAVGWLRSGN